MNQNTKIGIAIAFVFLLIGTVAGYATYSNGYSQGSLEQSYNSLQIGALKYKEGFANCAGQCQIALEQAKQNGVCK